MYVCRQASRQEAEEEEKEEEVSSKVVVGCQRRGRWGGVGGRHAGKGALLKRLRRTVIWVTSYRAAERSGQTE